MGVRSSRNRHRWFALALCLFLVVAAAGAAAPVQAGSIAGGPAVADRGHGPGHGNGRDEAKKRFTEVTGFADVGDEDSWAIPYIAQLYLQGLVKGQGHGRFNPKASISQAEAATLVVRAVAGGDAAALADAATIAGGTDWEGWLDAHTVWNVKAVARSARWSLPYLVVAVDKGLLTGDGDFRPNQAASRIWATELLVRGDVALGLLTPADVTGADLSLLSRFRDVAGLDSEAKLFLAAALAAGLVDGYPDHTFRPQAAISRAEFTALVARAVGGTTGEERLVRGRVLAVDLAQRTVTIATEGRETVSGETYATYTVRPDALIYAKVGDRFISDRGATLPLSSVQVGDRVTLQLDGAGQVAIIYDEYEVESATGVVTRVVVPSDTSELYQLELRTSDGATHAFQVAPYASVYLRGQPASMAVVAVGARATVEYHGAEAVSIRVTELPSSSEESGGGTGEQHGTVTLEGHVRSVTGENAFTMSVVLVDTGVVHVEIVYTVTTSADTSFVGVSGVSQLEAGDEVEVSGTADGYVIAASRVERTGD